jgi:cbb3-type cytochrome oxidase subunit 3
MKKLAFLLCLPLLFIGTFVFAYTSQEQKEAYDWAYSKGITTQPIEKANLN